MPDISGEFGEVVWRVSCTLENIIILGGEIIKVEVRGAELGLF